MSRTVRFGSRGLDALVGASTGLLAGAALILSQLPLVPTKRGAIWLTLGVVGGALVGWLGVRRWLGYVVVGVAAITAVIACTPLMQAPVESWIRRDAIPPQPLDAVVVLSADVNADGLLNVSAVERLLSALQLVRRNHSRLLVTTHIEESFGSRSVSSDADQRAIIALGGDTTAWRIVGPVGTTRDEAVATARLLEPAAAHTIAVVTEPMHTRRACATFERVGFRVVCVPSDERSYAIRTLPTAASRLRAFDDYVYERLGMIKYRLHGWVAE